MNVLCFSTNLDSTELAAWVQAIGTIVAVIAAAGIAIWQSRKQHDSALALHNAEQRHFQAELAKTLLVLCRNCTGAAKRFVSMTNNREAISKVAIGEKFFDFEELGALQTYVSSVPLHSLPSRLVGPAMALGATIRQFRQCIKLAIELHRSMDAFQFELHFTNMNKAIESLEGICGDIEKVLKTL